MVRPADTWQWTLRPSSNKASISFTFSPVQARRYDPVGQQQRSLSCILIPYAQRLPLVACGSAAAESTMLREPFSHYHLHLKSLASVGCQTLTRASVSTHTPLLLHVCDRDHGARRRASSYPSANAKENGKGVWRAPHAVMFEIRDKALRLRKMELHLSTGPYDGWPSIRSRGFLFRDFLLERSLYGGSRIAVIIIIGVCVVVG